MITRDNVTMQIDTVVYFEITDPKLYTYGVERPLSAIENLTATTLRNIIGDLELDNTLTSRDTINGKIRVILDEATAYIDAENEALIQEAMAKVIAGKTVLMIAHRLSTITDADKIVVIKDGQIIDEGTHENLLTSCTLYQEMWKAHMDTKDVA